MTKEQKQTFTLRISNANKSELMVVLCDMFLSYAEDTQNAMSMLKEGTVNEEEASAAVKDGFRHTRACLRELIQVLPLNAEYPSTMTPSEKMTIFELVSNIHSLYRYAERELIRAELQRESEGITNAVLVIKKLSESYKEASGQDSSGPVMQHTEKVYAGMTYGRGTVQENCSVESNRGFWA